MNDMLSKTNNLKPPDEATLRKAIAENAGWEAIRDAYNEATGEDRTRKSLTARAWRLGIKITPAFFGPATAWDDELLTRIMDSKACYADAVRRYNSKTGEQRSEAALKARWKRLADMRRRGRSPKPRIASPPPAEDGPRDTRQRIWLLRLYKDAHGIDDRQVTAAEFDEAMKGDVDSWPDGPVYKPGDLDCSNRDRGVRVHRVGLPHRRHGRAS